MRLLIIPHFVCERRKRKRDVVGLYGIPITNRAMSEIQKVAPDFKVTLKGQEKYEKAQ